MKHRMLRTALAGLVIVTAAQGAFSQEDGQDSERAYQRYEIEKVDPWGPFVLNLLLNFGIGSFVQGDTTGGLVVAGGQVIGIALVVVDLGRKQEVDEFGIAVPTHLPPLPGWGLGWLPQHLSQDTYSRSPTRTRPTKSCAASSGFRCPMSR